MCIISIEYPPSTHPCTSVLSGTCGTHCIGYAMTFAGRVRGRKGEQNNQPTSQALFRRAIHGSSLVSVLISVTQTRSVVFDHPDLTAISSPVCVSPRRSDAETEWNPYPCNKNHNRPHPGVARRATKTSRQAASLRRYIHSEYFSARLFRGTIIHLALLVRARRTREMVNRRTGFAETSSEQT